MMEVERLAAEAGDCADAVRLLAFTGLRFGEMAALRCAASTSCAGG
jgi:integrase